MDRLPVLGGPGMFVVEIYAAVRKFVFIEGHTTSARLARDVIGGPPGEVGA